MGDSAEIWSLVHAERRRLVEDLSALTPEQWSRPSLCPGWDVHDVVAHLVDTARTSRLSFVHDMIAARGNFDRANDLGIVRTKQADPQDTLAALQDAMSLTRTPPANLATRLVEAVVHGEDIRRPLGIPGHHPDSAVTRALRYQLRTPVSFGGGRERAAGFRLMDSASGAAWGNGNDVAGPALDLLLAVSGRQVDGDRFRGSGAARFVTACAPQPEAGR
ncbi:maleylpyruvate isomerase family mycothiol-dependent enzyme [Arthrobacter sp. JZ12]|uniref:maleylpyruvate isomerase family mycothiol-dependent enzyme n=1 Tax=Arthrobacter sp. JZ12 TaxID=2654190 RepID=UPI002B46E8B7|nr:maleylpyruvate isomerase family mycothiol-dependent enzyme [Arthrobacter sp. JZ12]WRH25990.1 maleylpyruvate isomerase family mycothiol-dependent enzyme [Arthrobacter sp. JZ12]